ncbi:POK10 protein, partial [Dyaphorophyia castanea]|nr:POK10 protein [Platysteira castanea]
WKYLGWIITDAQVRPQKVTICTDIKTLTDAQRVLGDLQWVRSIVGITSKDLAPLLPLLRGTDANEQ